MPVRRPALLAVLVLAGACALTAPARAQRITAGAFTFEGPAPKGVPNGWHGGPPGTVGVDRDVTRSGQQALRIVRDATSRDDFSTVTMSIPMEVQGRTIELSGWLRTAGVTDFSGLWMRLDGPSGAIAFDNMQTRHVRGDTEWTHYRVTLSLSPLANRIIFGVLQSGEGTTWADDLDLQVDGKPLAEAPRLQREITGIEKDSEFDRGSRVPDVPNLGIQQVESLVNLCKVWGFLKYHHTAITDGEHHWDYELFRILPLVLRTTAREGANEVMLTWIDALRRLRPCDPCAEAARDAQLDPNIEWINDGARLGNELRDWLLAVYERRDVTGRQYYLRAVPGVGNPEFTRELLYENITEPDLGYRLLALFRYWNIIEYWFPYRDLIEDDWDDVLREFIPQVAAAQGDEYRRIFLQLAARVGDTHANFWQQLGYRPPVGGCELPVILRFVEDELMVTGYKDPERGAATGLEVGDVILSLGGKTVEVLVAERRSYYAGSNEAVVLRDIARQFTHGRCGGRVNLEVRRAGETVALAAVRGIPEEGDRRAGHTHDRPGPAFQRLSDEVAYLKLSAVRAGETASYIEQAAGTRGLIIDIRNYPSEFVVFALGQHLVSEPTPFARFTRPDLANPGAFVWTEPVSLSPVEPLYDGRIAILVDETTVSQAEYTAMALRASPRAVVVGSTTGGADGNVSEFALPGGLRTTISGIGVFYADKSPTQRLGIVPDVTVRPTRAGLAAGRDEVLERALAVLLGREPAREELDDLLY